MRPLCWKTFALFLLLSLIHPGAEAGDLFKTDVSAGCGILSGATEYRIGGRIKTPAGTFRTHFPVSRLDFPINAWLFELRAGMTMKDRLTGTVSWGTELTANPGKMEDHDWQTAPDVLSIYSKSRLDMSADLFSGKFDYRLYQFDLGQYAAAFHPGDRCRMSMGAAFLYRRFDFKAYDTYQTYPAKNTGADFVSGRTLDYRVEYYIPLLELGIDVNTETFGCAGLTIGYSPYAEANDEDRHRLRNLTSEADCDGEALRISFRYRYNFLKQWYAALRLSHLEIKADGTSVTYLNGTWDHSIDADIESRQSRASLVLGCVF